MSAKEYHHVDRIGQVLAVGDSVAVADHGNLIVATVVKLTPQMVRVKKVGRPETYRGDGFVKYSIDMVKIDGEALTLWLLKTKNY